MSNVFAFILAEGGNGEGITDDLVTNLSPNDDTGDTTDGSASSARFEVTEAWLQYGLEEQDRLIFTIGKIDLTNYFDQNNAAGDGTSQFLSSAFINSQAIEFPDDNSGGVRLQLALIPDVLNLQVGGAETDADFEDVFDRPFAIGEIALTVKPFGATGVYRGGGWINAADHTELDDASNTDLDALGLYLSLDQELFGPITLFGRLAYQDKEVFNFPWFWVPIKIGLMTTLSAEFRSAPLRPYRRGPAFRPGPPFQRSPPPPCPGLL